MNKLDETKMFYTLDEVLAYLKITQNALVKKINLYNIGIRQLPGSSSEYLSKADVEVLERSIKQPGYPG